MAKLNFYQSGDTPCVKDADGMEKQTYKHFCAELLRQNGYKNVAVVSSLGKLGDKGVDIFAEKEGKLWAIQCRRYETKKVMPADVQQIEAARKLYNRDRAAILSNVPYSADAQSTAGGQHVQLWDREHLDELIHKTYPEYSLDYYRAMKKKDKKGNLKTDGKIVLMYILFFIIMMLIMKFFR